VAGKKEKVMACGQDMEQSGLLDDKLAGTFVKVSWKVLDVLNRYQ